MTEPHELSQGLQDRKDEAEVAKLEEEARKAKADADKAESDLHEAEANLATAAAKAVTDQRVNDTNARKAEQDFADTQTPEAQLQRDAEGRKAIAEADKGAAAARREQISALLPDLSKVAPSTLTSNSGPAVGGTMLMYGALSRLGKDIASRLPLKAGDRVLVTSDADLATSDATYQDVATGLEQLEAGARLLLDPQTADEVRGASLDPATDVIAALAGALPGLLSLFSAQRTLATASVTISDLAAVAAVAGAIKVRGQETPAVVHDDYRLVPKGQIYEKAAVVAKLRQELVGKKVPLTDEKTEFSQLLETEQASEKEILAAIKKAGTKVPPELPPKLDDARREIARLEGEIAGRSVRLGLIDSLVDAITTFMASIRTIPSGLSRSPLATASLQEQLHVPNAVSRDSGMQASGATAANQTTSAPDDPTAVKGFTHALLIKAQPGQSQQLLDNKPLWFEDRFTTIVDISVTFMLIEVPSSEIAEAGTVTVTASASGKLGDQPVLELSEPV